MIPIADPMRIADARLRGLEQTLRRQHGVITRDQAIAAGLSENEVDAHLRSGRWTQIYPRVYASLLPLDDGARVWAAVLWVGPGALLTGRAAYVCHGVLDRLPPALKVYVPKKWARRSQPGIRTIRSDVDPRDTVWCKGIHVASAARAGLDLARWGEERDYLDVALRHELTSPERIAATLARMTTLRGRARAARAANEVVTFPWSYPERLLHVGLTDAGITGWIANARARTDRGAIFPDIAFAGIKLAVEVKGRQYHDEAVDPKAFDRDHGREQALADSGWFVISFTAKQIENDLEGVIRTIRLKIAQLTALFA